MDRVDKGEQESERERLMHSAGTDAITPGPERKTTGIAPRRQQHPQYLPSPTARTLAMAAGLLVLALVFYLVGAKPSSKYTPNPFGPVVTQPKHSISMCNNCRADKALVLAQYEEDGVGWLNEVPDDWTIYRYSLRDRAPLAYLQFIVENYHRLPDYTVFAHGHYKAWYQVEPLAWKLRALNLTALDHEGYVNLRCEVDPGCTPDTVLGFEGAPPDYAPLAQLVGGALPQAWWERMMAPFGFGAFPDAIGAPCGSQFAVTRSAILSRSVDFYREYTQPLEMPLEEAREAFGESWAPGSAAALYEYTWHVVFGLKPVHCPAPKRCREVFFSNEIGCDRYPGRPKDSEGWEGIRCWNAWDGQFRDAEGKARLGNYVPPSVPAAAAG